MPGRTNHYESALEAYLRSHSIPFVNVEEVKKALFSGTRLKSFDYVVYSKKGSNLLVDVKGRAHKPKRVGAATRFENWATERDLADLIEWEKVFGDGFKGLLTFVYWIHNPEKSAPQPGTFRHRDRWYLLMGVDAAAYRSRMRRRSAKWETVALASEDFRSLARPLESWL